MVGKHSVNCGIMRCGWTACLAAALVNMQRLNGVVFPFFFLCCNLTQAIQRIDVRQHGTLPFHVLLGPVDCLGMQLANVSVCGPATCHVH